MYAMANYDLNIYVGYIVIFIVYPTLFMVSLLTGFDGAIPEILWRPKYFIAAFLIYSLYGNLVVAAYSLFFSIKLLIPKIKYVYKNRINIWREKIAQYQRHRFINPEDMEHDKDDWEMKVILKEMQEINHYWDRYTKKWKRMDKDKINH